MLAPTHRASNISPAISAERKTSEYIGVVRKFHDPTTSSSVLRSMNSTVHGNQSLHQMLVLIHQN
jgi:hypothetical protein